MQVMVLVKASQESESGQMPTESELAEMGSFNEKLVDAGVMVAGEGLHPSSRGVRIRFDGSTRTVIEGPFAETKDLVSGFWIWNVESMEEAIRWLKQAPFDGGAEVEIRPIFSEEDFGESFTPELREQERRLRERSASISKS